MMKNYSMWVSGRGLWEGLVGVKESMMGRIHVLLQRYTFIQLTLPVCLFLKSFVFTPDLLHHIFLT